MNARQHYAKAEQLILSAEQQSRAGGKLRGLSELIAAAQVHATLALAAAHGAHLPTIDELMPIPED